MIRSLRDRKSTPWANGLGSTTELVGLDEEVPGIDRDGRRWKLSVADLEQPADFSPLPGLQRTFVPVGASVSLEVDGRLHRVDDCVPLRFDGGATTVLVTLDAPCNAVNLMAERAELDLQVAASAADAPGAFALIALTDSERVSRFDLLVPGGDLSDEDLPESLGALVV
ncbi:HutD family protein [Gulosibacter sp. ACHW.36C]|uniref:HutD family protein n=1 Tax=Gulosibacter sediminis TaxID=1729695 RepID=A0ABY4MXK5_9MICO|nr:HutD family protein [Gulosibacter sediminis]UQN15156.1 HutD family protein [Gulosibacter sediminis]